VGAKGVGRGVWSTREWETERWLLLDDEVFAENYLPQFSRQFWLNPAKQIIWSRRKSERNSETLNQQPTSTWYGLLE